MCSEAIPVISTTPLISYLLHLIPVKRVISPSTNKGQFSFAEFVDLTEKANRQSKPAIKCPTKSTLQLVSFTKSTFVYLF